MNDTYLRFQLNSLAKSEVKRLEGSFLTCNEHLLDEFRQKFPNFYNTSSDDYPEFLKLVVTFFEPLPNPPGSKYGCFGLELFDVLKEKGYFSCIEVVYLTLHKREMMTMRYLNASHRMFAVEKIIEYLAKSKIPIQFITGRFIRYPDKAPDVFTIQHTISLFCKTYAREIGI